MAVSTGMGILSYLALMMGLIFLLIGLSLFGRWCCRKFFYEEDSEETVSEVRHQQSPSSPGTLMPLAVDARPTYPPANPLPLAPSASLISPSNPQAGAVLGSSPPAYSSVSALPSYDEAIGVHTHTGQGHRS